MNNFYTLAIAALLLLLCACEQIIPDPTDPRLPKYSEEGRGTAGALLNGRHAIFFGECGPDCFGSFSLISYLNGVSDSVQFELQMDEGTESGKVRFTLADIRLESLDDLEKIKGIYNLNNSPHKGYFNNCQGQRGRLEIRHVEGPGTPGSQNSGYIISGTFSVYTESQDCGTNAVEFGRFDLMPVHLQIE